MVNMERPQGRIKEETFRLQGRYAMFMRGEITVEDLDDEELALGRLKAIDGTFRGRPPKVVPGEMVAAMRREWLSRAEAKLREALMSKGIGVLTELAGNPEIDPGVRLRAAEKIIERTMGKVPDRVQLAAEDPIETLFRNILNDPEGLAPAPRELSADEREMLS
jgi:hypothetical protein